MKIINILIILLSFVSISIKIDNKINTKITDNINIENLNQQNEIIKEKANNLIKNYDPLDIDM
jgi:hypothetical protein